MMNNLFSEKQHFKQIWIWVLLILIDVFAIYQYINQIVLHTAIANPRNSRFLLGSVILLIIITLLFAINRLETKINEKGIYYRFFPFQLKFREITWAELSKCYVRQYSPLKEYGGWGMRIGIFSGKRAFNVSGNKGLQLNFNNGNDLLIGTQKPDELKRILQEIGKYSEPFSS